MIEITHTPDEGTVAWGVPRDLEPAEILRAADWCWSHHLDAWHLAGSPYQAVSMLDVDEAAAALRAAGFDVSLRIDDEQTPRGYSLRLAGDQILHLEGKLSKVDRLLDRHFRAIAAGGEISAAKNLWAIQMLIRRIDLEERLLHWREVGDGLVGGTPTHRVTGQAPYHDTTGHSAADDLEGPLP